MWTNNEGQAFNCKADAFEWLNNAVADIDTLKLYCDGVTMYERFNWGIFDTTSQCYIKGLLPIERYE